MHEIYGIAREGNEATNFMIFGSPANGIAKNHTLYYGISSVSSLSSDVGENFAIVRNAQLEFHATCPNNEDVCCKKPLIIETSGDKNCADDPDFHCVGMKVDNLSYG